MRKPLQVGVTFLGVSLAACTSAVGDDAVGQTEDALGACSPSDAWWKTQYDDNPAGYCEGSIDYSNCGPASMAMMRYALTCGKSDKTAAQMRSYINTTENNAATTCGGTTPSEWNKTFDNANTDGTWFADDTYSTMTTTNHCVGSGPNANYTAADLASDMANGNVTVAILAGSAANGQTGPCGWNQSSGHALFVADWNGSTFTVYDPDSHMNSKGVFVRCGSSKPGNYKAQWTQSDVTQWAEGFGAANSGKLCALTAKRTCIPGQTSASGCASGSAKTCAADFTWGSCKVQSFSGLIARSPQFVRVGSM
jgi:hypothetical protein